MKPHSSRRLAAVLAADIAASAITAMALTHSHPLLALEVTLGINAAAAVILPAPGVALAGRMARKALRAARAWTRHPAPADPQTGHAAWMARVRAIADEQANSSACGCEGMCSCRIPLEDWQAFCDELDLINRVLREWGRSQ